MSDRDHQWFEVTVRHSRASLARFGEAVLSTGATVRSGYARSVLEFDCLVGLSPEQVERFAVIARPVHMGRPARPRV